MLDSEKTREQLLEELEAARQRLAGFEADEAARRQTEDDLRKSERRFRIVADHAYAWEYWLDENMNVVWMSPSCERVTGHTAQEFQDDPALMLKLVHPEDRSIMEGHLQCDLSGCYQDSFDFRIINHNGDTRWLMHNCQAIIDNSGHYLGRRCSNLDITERIKAEQALAESERFVRGVLDGLSATIAIVDEFGFILMVNSAWRSFAGENGSDPDQVSEGTNYIAVCERATGNDVEEARRIAEGIRAVLSGKIPNFTLEYPCHSPDQKRWFCVRITRFPGDGPARAVVAHENITERKLIEEATLESEKKFRFLVENAPLGIFRSTLDGRFIDVNATHARIHGFDSPQELLSYTEQGTHVLFFDVSRHAELRQRLKAHGVLQNFESQRRQKDGSVVWVSTNARLTRDPSYEEPIIEGFVMDITDRKRSEQFREDVERIIHHNIKAPLSSLHVLAHHALKDSLDKEFRASVPGLIHSIRQVINLVDSSDKILQMERGEYTPQAGWFDVRKTMGNVALSLKAWTRAQQVRLAEAGMFDPVAHPEPPLFWGEEFLIEDMLLNLVKNAVEASPEGSDVTIVCNTARDGQRIDIHNRGVVPVEMRDRFFEKYATSGKFSGKGLGTYSARLVARAHGGRIEFTTSEAEGTTLTVVLPHPPSAS